MQFVALPSLFVIRKEPMFKLLTIASLCLLSNASQSHASQDQREAGVWPGWRGSQRDGTVAGPTWPVSLDDSKLKTAWKVEGLGPSYSGPVLDEKRVFITETVDREFERVRAYDRITGALLWESIWEGAMQVPFFAARNGSWIRSTPALDQDSLYVAGIRDVLACLDVETGELRWQVDFGERFETPLPPFGCASSPLLSGDHVYMQAGYSMVKLDKQTGKTLWRSMVEEDNAMHAGAFSSPVLATLAGVSQLVVQSRSSLAGLSIEDGSQLWSVPVRSFRGMNILTPSIVGSSIFTSTYGGRAQLFDVQVREQGWSVESRWDTGMQAYMSSPVVVEGHAFLFLKSNRLACINLETGEEAWTSPPTGDDYWSLALQGDRILALSDRGGLRLVEASPESYRLISERSVVESETWAHLAPAGEQLFVRSLDALIALDWR